VIRPSSTPALGTMATVSSAPGLPQSKLESESTTHEAELNVKSVDDFENPEDNNSVLSPHPDLSNEVANLSNKLISAINHQTNLDDALSATRQELETTQEYVKKLEAENRSYKDQIANGLLVRKAEVESQASKFTTTIAEEKEKRTAAEHDKKKIEQELENLTTALFEEANQVRFREICWLCVLTHCLDGFCRSQRNRGRQPSD
jgi:chromosome segregation ATPase